MNEAQAGLADLKERLMACSKDIEGRKVELQKLQKKQHAADLQIQELEHCKTKTTSDSKGAAKAVSSAYTIWFDAVSTVQSVL